MFTHLIFLILILLLINFSSEAVAPRWIESPWEAFGWGFLLYFALLALIYFQNRLKRISKNALLNLANLEFILFFGTFFFILGGQRLLYKVPLLASSQALEAVFFLSLYAFGIAFFYYSWNKLHHQPYAASSSTQQLRLIFPFALPFLFFLLFLDLLSYLPSPTIQEALYGEESWILFVVSILFMALMLILLPPLIVKIWKCIPMEEGELKNRLQALCKRAHFKHNGILDWTILNRSHTAAILGVLPSLRYVIFTKKLQQDLNPDSIEAILAHEIGHSYRKHLLIYPFILLGMGVLISLFTVEISPFIERWFNDHFTLEWQLVYPFAYMIPYALILALYFRYVFGLFSRLFERQADLHCFELNLPPENMIRALDDVAIATGYTHLLPNWHHHSIQERIDFIRQASQNPKMIPQHHQKVRVILAIYILLLILAIFYLFYGAL